MYLGIRVEMKEHQLRSILKDTFETKLSYQGEHFTATTYCMNQKDASFESTKKV